MKKTVFATMICLSAFPLVSSAGVVDLNGLVHGQIIQTNQFTSQGITYIKGDNFNNSQDLIVAFDTTKTGTADPDLQDPWATGNLAPNTNLGNALIIQEGYVSKYDRNRGIVSKPDDEGAAPSGKVEMRFDMAYQNFGYDLLDIEGAKNGKNPYHSVSFFYQGGLIGTVSTVDYVTNNNPFFDSSIMYGDNSANRISPISIADLNSYFGKNAAGFDKVQFYFNGSQAIDTFVFTKTIPEPASALLMLGSAFGFGVVRRRRNKKAAAEAC